MLHPVLRADIADASFRRFGVEGEEHAKEFEGWDIDFSQLACVPTERHR